ncbi:hypothetical protein NECID01_0103 [Nematocida sp. AWRm77]|nr:hypothetical protein NECID01_0103 [Nematocida sp. AWRm77]
MNRKDTIQRIEEELVRPKPWYEKGEVTVKDRPKNSLLFQPEHRDKKKKPAQENDFEDSCESDEFKEKIEFIRSKTTLKISADMERVLETLVCKKIKDKAYDNPRKENLTEKKPKHTEPEEVDPAQDRAPLHDAYEGRRTENDKFMDKAQLVSLLGEIDRDLAEIADCMYVPTRIRPQK